MFQIVRRNFNRSPISVNTENLNLQSTVTKFTELSVLLPFQTLLNLPKVHYGLRNLCSNIFTVFKNTSFVILRINKLWKIDLKRRTDKNPRYSGNHLTSSPVNVISRLMWSHFKVPFTKDYYIKITGYHSVNVITFGLAQSDHIKLLLLYYVIRWGGGPWMCDCSG